MAGNSDEQKTRRSDVQKTADSAQTSSPADQELSASRDALRTTEAKLRLGIAVAGLGMGEMDYLEDTITLDEIAAELFSLPVNMPIRRGDIHARFHPDDAAVLAAKIADVINPAGNGFMATDHRVLRPDGSVRWVSTRKQVEFAAPNGGGLKRATTGLLVVMDISDRIAAAHSQHDSEQHMRLATEATGVGIWEWNIATGEIWWDAQMFKIYGVRPTPDGRVDYSTWTNSVLQEDLPQQEAILRDTVRTRGQSRREFRIRRNDDRLCRNIESVETVRTNVYGHAEWVVGTNLDITVRKRSEEVLRQNERLFYTLIDEAPTGVYVVDDQFRLRQVNALALPVFESVSPLIGRNFSDVICTLWGIEIGGQIITIFRHTLETGEPYISPTFSSKRADIGVQQSFEWQTKRVTLVDGRHGVACYFRDVTEHQRTEQTLRQSEAKFRATFDNAAVGIAHVGPDGSWLDVNQRLCEILGYSHDEIVAKTFQDITHPGDLEADLDCVNKLLVGQADSYMMEKRYIRKNGTIVWANLTVACVRDGEGKIDYFVSVVEDISARKAAEKAQDEAKRRLQNALEAGGLGAWDLDLETNISHSDSKRRSMLGTASADISHAEFLSLIHPEDIEKVEATLARASDPDSGGHFQFEYRIRRPSDGVERWMSSRGQTIFENRRPVRITGVSYDFTERKFAEEHLKLLMREVNHRSKNLLSVVQAVARQTARKSDPATFVVQLSERIDGLAASQDLLVKNLWQGVDVAALIEAQLSHFKDLIGTRIVVDGPLADLTPPAAQGIGMALHELATNAAKYGALSNSTGRVTIKWQVVADYPPEFLMTWIEDGGPPVEAPTHSGFGQMVIGRMVESAINGKAEIEYRDSGFRWTLTGPVESALEAGRTK
jgi:PAS domain S-box-containing protein